MSEAVNAVIHFSLDNSQVDSILSKTLEKTVKMEKTVGELDLELDKLARTAIVESDKFEEIARRSEVIAQEMDMVDATAKAWREVLDETKVEISIQQAETDALEKQIEINEKAIDAANAKALTAFRKTAAFGTYFFQAIGFGLGQTLSLLAETLSLTIETIRFAQEGDFVAALSNPVSQAGFLISLGARVLLIAGLLILQVQIQIQSEEVSTSFNAIIGGLRIATI